MVAFVILNYNNVVDTIKCIESIEQYNSYPVKYIVVDNGSSVDGIIDKLDEFLRIKMGGNYGKYIEGEVIPEDLPKASLLICNDNEGYARGNNKGLQLLYADSTINYVMVLNNDILFIEDIIPKLIFSLETLSDAAIVSPVLYKKNRKDIDLTCARRKSTVGEEIIYNFLHYVFPKYVDKKLERRYILLDDNTTRSTIPIDLPSGSCMLFKKSMFKSIGSFDPNTFLYWEEQILCEKIAQIGKKNYLCKDLKCIHLGGASTSVSVKSQFTIKCGNDSSLYYWKNYSNISSLQYHILRISISFNYCVSLIRNLIYKIFK